MAGSLAPVMYWPFASSSSEFSVTFSEMSSSILLAGDGTDTLAPLMVAQPWTIKVCTHGHRHLAYLGRQHPFSLSVMCTPSPVDVDRGVLPLLFPKVHDHLLCLVDVECEVIFLTPHSEGPHLLPVGRLVVVGNQAYHCSVVRKLDD